MERPSFTRQDTDAPSSSVEKQPIGETIIAFQDDGSKEKQDDGIQPHEREVPLYSDDEKSSSQIHLDTAEDIVKAVITVADDPTLNPWTFRMFFLGLGLSAFGAVLEEIYIFKPQIVYVSTMFLTVIAYAGGELMSLIPRWGPIGRFLNPHPFNMKEHAAIVIMASAASVSAQSTQVIAAQKLFYGGYPSQGAAIFITMSTQLIGYGLAGMMRGALLWPTKMFYPANLPVSTVLETLHNDKSAHKKRMKVFWMVFTALLVWELIPEYIMPLLIGFSVFCLADQSSLVFTNLFGGTNGNEGVGFLSISLDWNYIAGFGSPLWLPLQTLTNACIGTIGCIILFMGAYYANHWRAKDFPFLSSDIYDNSSNSTLFTTYNQTLILNPNRSINDTLVDQVGIPHLTATYVVSLITNNMGFTANFVHMFLWNFHEIKEGWSFINLANIKKALVPSTYFFWRNGGQRTEGEKEAVRQDPAIDPHYKAMLNYDEAPDSWYAAAFFSALITSLVCLYILKSTLPWWGVIFGLVVLYIFMLFFGTQYALTGFQFNLSSVAQTLGGYLFPRRPLANMYFTCYTWNAFEQGCYLLRDLKLAQQMKLSHKCTYTTQMLGCIFGALLNYVMMFTIIKNQEPTLLSIEGTAIWSGVNIQALNSAAITWAIAPKMYSFGARYEWVSIAYFIGPFIPLPFYFMNKFFPRQRIWSYLNLSIILWYMGYLVIGVNSSITSYFLIGAFGQFYLRKYRPKYFIKWNYLVSAAMDGGTQVMVFLLSFAVAGASGVSRPFPEWWGNSGLNSDRCAYNPANGS